MKTEPQTRQEFAAYFLALKASMESDGAKVNKSSEWTFFIQHKIDDGSLPVEANKWKCPRSLENELNKKC